MTKKEFIEKHGEDWQRPIGEFIYEAPNFKGDLKLALQIASVIADLQELLKGKGE